MDDRVVEVRCTGCGEILSVLRLRGGAPAEAEELLARVQTSPPFCVVCSCRTMVGPRPGTELWERISTKETPIPGLGHSDLIDGPVDLHDKVGY